MENRKRLTGKIKIAGIIHTKTGLHIGGSKSTLDIGGVDLNVIKSPKGIPFIPGSSLKGKLRSMLAKIHGSTDIKEDTVLITEIFGSSGDNKNRGDITRLLVRDAYLDIAASAIDFDNVEMELYYTDVKTENTINRKTGTAEHPRQLERVPAGVAFGFEMIYDVYDDKKTTEHLTNIRTAMRLLENDYIGGSGSRGYGKIAFPSKTLKIQIKEIADYETGNEWKDYTAFQF